MKKTLIFTLCFSIFFLSLISPAFADTAYLNLDSNVYYEDETLISYNLDSMFNSTAYFDFSLNGIYMNNFGGYETTGYFGNGIDFERGESDYMMSENASDLDLTEVFTIMFWTKMETLDASTWFFQKSDLTTNNFGYRAKMHGDEVRFAMYSGGAWRERVSIDADLVAGLFYHIAIVSNEVAGNLKIYVNGTTYYDGIDQGDGDPEDGLSPLYLGTSFASQYFDGIIDEFRIFKDVALSSSEITTWMNREIQTPLTITGLSEEDVVQLWYNASTLYEQQTVSASGNVTFNVYDFSFLSSPYDGVLNIYHEDIQYEGYVMVLNWGDIYKWQVLGVFADLFTQLFFGTGAWLGLIIVVSSALLLSNFVRYGSLVFYPILFFFGLGYLTNVSADSNLLYATVICWMTIPLLLFIETKQK